MALKLTRELALAAGLAAANRHMREAGRTTWNEDDYHAAWDEFDRLWPLCKHGVEPQECRFCEMALQEA